MQLTIVTPEGEVFRDRAQEVTLPGSEGEFGVLPGHVRFLSSLDVGEVRIRSRDRTLYAAISGGFAEVSGDEVVILADTCELSDQIDVARAERAKARAERELAALKAAETEAARFKIQQGAISRAVNRIAVAGRR